MWVDQPEPSSRMRRGGSWRRSAEQGHRWLSYRELADRGVPFQGPPADYPWNAYCAYFFGPDDEVWELYAWREGGGPGKLT